MSRSSSSPGKQDRWSDKMPCTPASPSHQPHRRRSSSTPPQSSDHGEEEAKSVGPRRGPFDAGGFRLGKVPSRRGSCERQSQGDSEEPCNSGQPSTSHTAEVQTKFMPSETMKISYLGFSPDGGEDGENQSSVLTYLSEPPSPKRLSLHSSSIGSPVRQDDQSLENYTSTSASGEPFSPMSLTHTHPLSSASTSLSRSAKSGKEGKGDKEKEEGNKDSALVAVRQQRSAQWKENQVERRNQLQKRKHALLELVETTVSHTDHLKALAIIYLPQAALFPSLSDIFTKALLPKAVELLDFNERLQGDMIKVLKEEGVGYNEGGIKRKSEGDVFKSRTEKEMGDEITEMEIDLSGRLDKAIKQIVKLCLDAVSFSPLCTQPVLSLILYRNRTLPSTRIIVSNLLALRIYGARSHLVLRSRHLKSVASCSTITDAITACKSCLKRAAFLLSRHLVNLACNSPTIYISLFKGLANSLSLSSVSWKRRRILPGFPVRSSQKRSGPIKRRT